MGNGSGPDPSKQPDPAPPRTVQPDPVPGEELAALVGRAPLSAGSVEDLNRQLAKDAALGLRVVRTLVDDPAAWDRLFTLDERHRASLGVATERSRDAAPMSGLVEKAAVFAGDLTRTTIVVITPETGVPLEEAEDNGWWVPDKLEIKGSTDTTGTTKVEATVTWTF